LNYARAGASLSLVSRDRKALNRVKDLIQKEIPTVKAMVLVADVIDPDAVKAAVDNTIKEFGRIDIAIANAGKMNAWNKRMY
jgi:NADP-dependent 3-hydroxy acid dehydrogenase YdfG